MPQGGGFASRSRIANVVLVDDHVAATLRAKAAVAYLGAFVAAKKFRAFRDFDVLRFEEREAGDGRAGVTAAVVAVTITHVERRTLRLDLDRSAITGSRMCFRCSIFHIWSMQSDGLTAQIQAARNKTN